VSVPFVEELTTFKSKLDYALRLLIKDPYSLRFIPESASESEFTLPADLEARIRDRGKDLGNRLLRPNSFW
jgi:hypothetical protein